LGLIKLSQRLSGECPICRESFSSRVWLYYKDKELREARELAKDGAIKEVESKKCLDCRRYKRCKIKKVYCREFKKLAERRFLELFRTIANFPLRAIVVCPNCGQSYHIRSTYSQLRFIKRKVYLTKFFQMGKIRLEGVKLEPQPPAEMEVYHKSGWVRKWLIG